MAAPTITQKAERFLRSRWYKLDTAGTLYSWFINPSLDARKNYTFEEIVCEVSAALRSGSEPENLVSNIAPNRALLRNRLFRLLPLPIKSTAIAAVYHLVSGRPVTSAMSNLGVIDLPDEMRPFISDFIFIHTGLGRCNFCSGLCLIMSGLLLHAHRQI